jgi:hypothetical protein
MAAVREINWGIDERCRKGKSKIALKNHRGRLLCCYGLSTSIRFLQPSGMGSSGIALVGYGIRLSLPAAVIVVLTPTATALWQNLVCCASSIV